MNAEGGTRRIALSAARYHVEHSRDRLSYA
jgi:hypothetical protein